MGAWLATMDAGFYALEERASQRTIERLKWLMENFTDDDIDDDIDDDTEAETAKGSDLAA